MPTPPTERDVDFIRLFRWAMIRYREVTEKPAFAYTAEILVRLLSLEGVRNELKISEVRDGLPLSITKPLRYFRKLDQEGRLRRVTRLLKECQ